MNWPKILLGTLIGFSATSYHYQRQIAKQRQDFIECQVAWEKYYSLNNQSTQIIQPVDPNQTLWQMILQRALNIVQTKVQESSNPFSKEQEKYLVYHYEVLPKCSKIKAWVKHSLDKNKV